LVRDTRRKLQPFIVGSYINVPDQGIKNSGPVYYGANYPRLRRVKAKYDPENVFRFPQSIPPCLPETSSESPPPPPRNAPPLPIPSCIGTGGANLLQKKTRGFPQMKSIIDSDAAIDYNVDK